MILMLGVMTTSITTFYGSKDLPFLLALPVPVMYQYSFLILPAAS